MWCSILALDYDRAHGVDSSFAQAVRYCLGSKAASTAMTRVASFHKYIEWLKQKTENSLPIEERRVYGQASSSPHDIDIAEVSSQLCMACIWPDGMPLRRS
eukprot:1410209-Amphidinium_carterae.1